GDHVHDPVFHERRGLEGILAADARALQTRHPCALELVHVTDVDLFQRRVPLVGEVAAVGDPVLADRAAQQPVDLGIGGPHGRSGEQEQRDEGHGRDHGAPPCRSYGALRGYTTMKLSRLGMVTFGSVCAFISSCSPMMPLRWSRYAVSA